MSNEMTNATNVATVETTSFNSKPVRKHKSYLSDTTWANRVSEATRNLVFILRNNVEIRRYTSIGILNYLLQKGEIKGKKRKVDFLWNKFAVKVDGFTREFKYTEPFFINCFVASFSSFSASAQQRINAFCEEEMTVSASEAVNLEEINNIIALNTQSDKEYNTSEE
ncbi:MAG: hypothetical protein KNU04_gp72 [crAssphage sp. isolate ctbg_1]|uniref:Uncharacterized protein n=1 Tax=crAssphage sp. isolate ctbg_1 TaxID=2989854 RepID=A0A345MT17_9CAUD|nr:MAG: hypothetical protein KNU04_gp72 [crAssphage sp. isolate ctbg_1]AXH74517.1 MAG: hypothetical protein [crAssphage sp. isolate ctbg_1]